MTANESDICRYVRRARNLNHQALIDQLHNGRPDWAAQLRKNRDNYMRMARDVKRGC